MMKADPVDTGQALRSASYEELDGDLAIGLLILVDHASNLIPSEYGGLGLPEAELRRHIAYDIGAAPLARELSERLNAPAILTRFSRLIIDPNRGEDDPTLLMQLSDGAIVPGNRSLDLAERERRLNRFHRPYHAAIERLIDGTLRTGVPPILLSIHSYTPDWKGTRRPWHAGILWDRDPRLARLLIDRLYAEHGLRIGDNEPYLGSLKNDTMYRHGTGRGLAHALLEVRNDLIETPAGVQEWADRLEPILGEAIAEPALHVVRHFGSESDDDATRQGEDDAADGRRHPHGA